MIIGPMRAIKYFSMCLAALGMVACNRTLESSDYDVYSVKNDSGTEVQAGVYLPKGYSSKVSLPVVYICDNLVMKSANKYCHVLDSMVENEIIRPVVAVIANDLTEETIGFFADNLKPFVEKRWNVDSDRDAAVFCGAMTSADAGLVMSFERQELISDYWLISPVVLEYEGLGMLDLDTQYHFMWSSKDESADFDDYSSLLNYVRKRGGSVKKHAFLGIGDSKTLRELFCANMEEHFGK